MKYRLILEDYQINLLKKHGRIQPQDIYCEVEILGHDQTVKIECFLYELYDQLIAWNKNFSLNNFICISYKNGYEIRLFIITPTEECYKIDFLNGISFDLSQRDIQMFAKETKDALLECMKIWYSDEEISSFQKEMF